jgi:DNA-directed RNA polymerase subunit RPC12/RpoP
MKIVKDETFPALHGYTCNRCGRTDTKDTSGGLMEVQEYLHYEDCCGYGADASFKYGDGDKISISLCQYCKHKLLAEYFDVVEY